MRTTEQDARWRESPFITSIRWADYRVLPATYELFMQFVRHELAPHMELKLVEEDFYKDLWQRWNDYRFTIDEIARGHGKTEWQIWDTLYDVVRQPKNPHWDLPGDKRVIQQLLVSSGGLEAKELAERVEEYVFASPMLRQLVPRGVSKNRTSSSWNKKKQKFSNGSIIHYRQVKCRRGLHVDKIRMDDLITESSSLSDKDTKRFVLSAILPMGVAKRASVRITGTPLRATDIIHEMDKTGAYEHTKLPAIFDWETQQILSKRLTWAALMEAKRQIGSVKFEAEYQLNALENRAGIIRRSWIEKCFDKSLDFLNIGAVKEHEAQLRAKSVQHESWRDQYYAVYGGIDYAFADIETADWSVYATVGDRGPEITENRFDILGAERFKGQSLGWQLKFMQEWHALWQHDIIGVEANSIRGSVKDLKQLNLPLKLFWTGSVDERDKRKPAAEFHGRIHSVSKRNFALRHGMQYENQQLRIPYKSHRAQQFADRLLLECVSWALEDNKLVEIGIHPDIPIAVQYAIETALGHSFGIA